MTAKLRLGIAGLVHDHVWGELARWAATGAVEIVAVADPHAELVDRARREFGIGDVFDDPRKMLDESALDIVQICASNAEGAEIAIAAAERHVHAVVEKPMAATLDQAERMLEASERAGTLLFVNWPFRWRPATPHAWKLVGDGLIGDVFHARIRMAHAGPRELGCSEYFCDWLFDPARNGAGALVDYCSYGAVACRHLFGRPNAVQGVMGRLVKQDIEVADNAAITLIYDRTIAVTEASWTQIPSYHDAVYLGTTGTLWTEAGSIFLARAEGERRSLSVDPLPSGASTGPECFLDCLDSGREPPDVCHPRVARDAQEILELGLRSAESGRRMKLP